MTNCNFIGNTANIAGGGIFNVDASPKLVNCSFSVNMAPGGGGIFNGNSSPILTNCSFSLNKADFTGGGIYNDNSSPTLTNCIVWGNTREIDNTEGSSSSVTYSIVQGGYPGTQNLDQDPLFLVAANGNLRLQKGFPAIDAGETSANSTPTDLDGKPRVKNGKIDMGAFEFHEQAVVVSSFTLINAATDKAVQEIKDGEVIDLAILMGATLNIRANTILAREGSVVLELTGPQTYHWTEQGQPYMLFGDLNGNIFGRSLPVGEYTLTATPFSGKDGSGSKGSPLTIRFTVAYSATVSTFTLVDASTNLDIKELVDGDVIYLADFPVTNFNIRAKTDPSQVGSLVFKLDGPLTHARTENLLPYALLGDDTKGGYYGDGLSEIAKVFAQRIISKTFSARSFLTECQLF